MYSTDALVKRSMNSFFFTLNVLVSQRSSFGSGDGRKRTKFRSLAISALPILAKAAELGKADVEKRLAILDGALAGKKFLVGESFTLADAHLAGFMTYVGMCGFDVSKYSNIDAWAKAGQSRPAYAKIMRSDA